MATSSPFMKTGFGYVKLEFVNLILMMRLMQCETWCMSLTSLSISSLTITNIQAAKIVSIVLKPSTCVRTHLRSVLPNDIGNPSDSSLVYAEGTEVISRKANP